MQKLAYYKFVQIERLIEREIMKVPIPAAGGVARMIDEACGLDRDWAHSFAGFVWETVWIRFAPPDDRPGVTIHRCLKGCGRPSVGVCERCRAIPQGEEGRARGPE